MGPISVEMIRSYHRDRMRDAERGRLAAIARGRRWGGEAQLAEAPVRAPATLPTLRELAHATNAVKVGSVIEVGGTGALGADGRVLHLGDAYQQTRRSLQVVNETLRRFGAGLDDVVRTRVYLKKSWQWEEVSRAHGEVFGPNRPVTTFVGAGGFPDSDMLVSIEATAVVR
jgi:enamine deaminase RidA (YjgF/YER057c/UK114 family)